MSEAMGLLDVPIVLRLSLALVHFVWQGAIAAVVALLVLVALRRASAAARYAALLVVFAGMAACPVVTFAVLPGPAEPMPAGALIDPVEVSALPVVSWEAASMAMAPAPPLPSPDTTRSESWRTRLGSAWEWLAARLPWVAAAWVVGVLALSLRLLVAWGRMARSRRRGADVGAGRLRDAVAALSARLRVSRPVRLMESAAAGVPTVIGWLRPAILLPTSALAGLTPEQLEAVIAHELAHVRRHDYLVNLAQTVVETLLFYHPAVWWLSNRIRLEREHCCDDTAVSVCGDALAYARALAELGGLRAPQPAVASAGGSLSSRVHRILGISKPRGAHISSGVAALFALGGLVVAAIALGVSAQRCAAAADARVNAAARGGATIHATTEPGEEAATAAEEEAQEEDAEAEGQPTIRRIEFGGLRGLTADQLLAVMETKPGDRYDLKRLAGDVQRIEELFGAEGYVMLVTSAPHISDAGVLALKLSVSEAEGAPRRGALVAVQDRSFHVATEGLPAVLEWLKGVPTAAGSRPGVVTFDMHGISIEHPVRMSARALGATVVLEEGVTGPITLEAEAVPAEAKRLLDTVCAAGGLQWRRHGSGAYIVSAGPEPTAARAATPGSPADAEDVVYAIINLEHTPAGYVGSLFYPRFKLQAGWPALGGGPSGALAELLPPGIRFISAARYDSRRLLVAGTPEAVVELREFIGMLDKEPQQVLVQWSAWAARPAAEAPIELHDLDGEVGGDYDLKIGYVSDASVDAIARAFPSVGPHAAARIALLNLMPEIVPLPQSGRLPPVLLQLSPRINGDGTITMTLALVPMDDPEEPSFAAMPQDAELLATVNVNSGEGFLIVVTKGESAMTILIEPTIADAT